MQVLLSAYPIDEMPVEVIADCAHLPASSEAIYKIKVLTNRPWYRLYEAAGMTEGESFLGSLERTVLQRTEWLNT